MLLPDFIQEVENFTVEFRPCRRDVEICRPGTGSEVSERRAYAGWTTPASSSSMRDTHRARRVPDRMDEGPGGLASLGGSCVDRTAARKGAATRKRSFPARAG